MCCHFFPQNSHIPVYVAQCLKNIWLTNNLSTSKKSCVSLILPFCCIYTWYAAGCHGCMTYLSFPPQSTPECSRSLPKNYTASSVTPSSAKKWEDVSGVLFFGSFPVVCYIGDAIKHCVLAVTRENCSLGKKGVKTSSLFCVVFHSNG